MPVSDLREFMGRHLHSLGRSEAYIQTVDGTIRDFLETLPCKEADRITPAMVRTWYQDLEGSPRTRNRKKQTIQMMFKELVNAAYIDKSPADGLRAAKMKTDHREPYTEQEIERLLDLAGDLKPLLIVCMTTALRRTDAARLNWKQIDIAGGWVRVATGKTGEVAEIPLDQKLLEILPAPQASGPVFPEIAGMRLDRLTKRFAEIRKKAGIQGNKDFHSFRVTWITNALSAGVPMEIVRRVTGHQTVEVVLKHYFRPGRGQMLKELSRIPGYSDAAAQKQKAAEILSQLTEAQAAEAVILLTQILKQDRPAKQPAAKIFCETTARDILPDTPR